MIAPSKGGQDDAANSAYRGNTIWDRPIQEMMTVFSCSISTSYSFGFPSIKGWQDVQGSIKTAYDQHMPFGIGFPSPPPVSFPRGDERFALCGLRGRRDLCKQTKFVEEGVELFYSNIYILE